MNIVWHIPILCLLNCFLAIARAFPKVETGPFLIPLVDCIDITNVLLHVVHSFTGRLPDQRAFLPSLAPKLFWNFNKYYQPADPVTYEDIKKIEGTPWQVANV